MDARPDRTRLIQTSSGAALRTAGSASMMASSIPVGDAARPSSPARPAARGARGLHARTTGARRRPRDRRRQRRARAGDRSSACRRPGRAASDGSAPRRVPSPAAGTISRPRAHLRGRSAVVDSDCVAGARGRPRDGRRSDGSRASSSARMPSTALVRFTRSGDKRHESNRDLQNFRLSPQQARQQARGSRSCAPRSTRGSNTSTARIARTPDERVGDVAAVKRQARQAQRVAAEVTDRPSRARWRCSESGRTPRCHAPTGGDCPTPHPAVRSPVATATEPSLLRDTSQTTRRAARSRSLDRAPPRRTHARRHEDAADSSGSRAASLAIERFGRGVEHRDVERHVLDAAPHHLEQRLRDLVEGVGIRQQDRHAPPLATAHDRRDERLEHAGRVVAAGHAVLVVADAHQARILDRVGRPERHVRPGRLRHRRIIQQAVRDEERRRNAGRDPCARRKKTARSTRSTALLPVISASGWRFVTSTFIAVEIVRRSHRPAPASGRTGKRLECCVPGP